MKTEEQVKRKIQVVQEMIESTKLALSAQSLTLQQKMLLNTQKDFLHGKLMALEWVYREGNLTAEIVSQVLKAAA